MLTRVAQILSLDRLDDAWAATCKGSLVGRLWLNTCRFAQRQLPPSVRILGRLCEFMSYLLILGLCLSLALPQFVLDKGGLAILVICALALRLMSFILGGKQAYKTNAIDMLVLVFLGVCIVATFASHYLVSSVKGLSKVVVYVVAYFVFVQAFSQSRTRIVLTWCLLAVAGVCVALYGLYQYETGVAPLATWEDPTVEVKGTRIYSSLGNPNLLAGYLIPLVPVTFCLGLVALCRKNVVGFLVALCGLVIVLVGTVLTGSRGGYIGLAAGQLCIVLVASSWLWRQYPRVRIVICALLLVLPFVAWMTVHMVPTMEQRVLSIFSGWEHSSNAFRLNVWRSSWLMFLDNWWIGIGIGNETFRLVYGLYMKSGFDALGTYCVPLEIAVETGVLGVIAFGALMTVLFARAHVAFWNADDAVGRWLVLGLISGVVGILAHGLSDTVFYRPQVQFVFWLIVASLVALRGAAWQDRSGAGSVA
ncbi:MAG: O-antigen ligase family protein [Candidatus Melainabacteria bacterium]|nr:O-antigen ligase family protein [Candidatus Melainabacteria bacterium]